MSDFTTQFQDVTREGMRSLGRWVARVPTKVKLSVVVFLFLLVVCWPWIVVTVPSGYVAVRWWRLFGGTDVSQVYDEGLHFNFPWDEMPIYDVRIQQVARDFDVLTADGMVMSVNVALRFRANRDTIGLLHKNVGSGYVETLVLPAVGTYARQVFAQYAAEDVYAAQRLAVQQQIRQAVIEDLAPRVPAGAAPVEPWVRVDDVLIRSMKFPPAVEAAINRKMEQYQIRKEYEYRIERERLESERKKIEADGIAQFQQIVGAGISENYLRWKGIDATLALAQSQNAKVVVIGAPRDGMPLILGNGTTSDASASAPRASGTPASP